MREKSATNNWKKMQQLRKNIRVYKTERYEDNVFMFGIPNLEEKNLGEKLLKVILKGTSVCPGDIVAHACVIMDLKDIGLLQTGDIFIKHIVLMWDDRRISLW